MRVFNRLRLPGLLVGALALVLVGCGGGGGGTPDAGDAETDFIVIQEIPTNRQEVTANLVEVGGQIEIKFSANLDADTILDPSNPFNGLSANLNMLDSNLIRVPGTPEVKGKYFRFIPPSTGLTSQQYTMTVSRNVLSTGGQALQSEFYSGFTVGPDIYAPIIRKTVPVQNQKEVARGTTIRVVFNESLDPGSVNSQTVIVQDGGQNPPVTLAGTLLLQSDGFEIVWIPDPLTGMPPSTTVVVTLQGGNGGIADETSGIPFVGDATNNNLWTLQFDTAEGNEPLNQIARASLYFINSTEFGVIDITPFTLGGPGLTPIQDVIPNSEKKVGTPSDIVIDPRVNGNGDTFAYVVDRDSSTVAVLNTLNSRLVGRIPVRGPRGIGVQPGGILLYVSEFSTDAVKAFNISNAMPGTNTWIDAGIQIAPGLGGSAIQEGNTQVGRGPAGVACAPDQAVTFVVNNIEGTSTLIRQIDHSVLNTWQTGAAPIDVGISVSFPGLGYFACVTNLGVEAGDQGSASLWWSNFPNNQQWLITGLNNPRGLAYDYGVNWYVANSSGNTISEVQIQIQGNTIVPAITTTYNTYDGPQNCALDPLNLLYMFPSCQAAGLVDCINVTQPNEFNLPVLVPGVKMVASLASQ